jgi:Transcriptional accessory protein
MNSYRVLAINRGEKAKILSVKILADEQIVQNYLNFRLVKKAVLKTLLSLSKTRLPKPTSVSWDQQSSGNCGAN